MVNEWRKPEHVAAYLQRMQSIPHRTAAEETLLSEVPKDAKRVLDLGCGNGHLLDCVLAHCPHATGVGIDFSPAMLQLAHERFANNHRVTLIEHNLDDPLPDLGSFDCVVSSFAIHHCCDLRKREIYAEAFSLLEPGGVFCNLEHVASPTLRVHAAFVAAMGMTLDDEDPSNKLLDVATQLEWFRQIGFIDVDCLWKWRELALLVGRRTMLSSSNATELLDIVLDDRPTIDETVWLDHQLTRYNFQQRDTSFEPLNIVARHHDGKIVAGLAAVSGWQWLYIQLLWVDESIRHEGLGSRILVCAEDEAKRRGCVGACLSSYSFQAPEFYRKLGYRVFGQIDDYPFGDTMYFFSKRFEG